MHRHHRKIAVFGHAQSRWIILRESKRFFVWKCIYHSSVFNLLLVSYVASLIKLSSTKGVRPRPLFPPAPLASTHIFAMTSRTTPFARLWKNVFCVIICSSDCGYTKGIGKHYIRHRADRREDECVCGAHQHQLESGQAESHSLKR